MPPHTNRLTRACALALAIAAAAAPAAVARPVDASADWKLPKDFQTADTRDAVTLSQDIRNPDTVDYANGRGTYNAPEVVVVEAAAPVAAPTAAGGLDWADVGIGAGGLLAVALIGVGGALAIVHRRGARELAS